MSSGQYRRYDGLSELPSALSRAAGFPGEDTFVTAVVMASNPVSSPVWRRGRCKDPARGRGRRDRARPDQRRRPQARAEFDRLSNILKTFNDQFGNIPWTDADRVHKLITEDIPDRVAADTAYQNATKNSDWQNARIEHDKALARVMTAVLQDDTELFKQFVDNESFRRWLTDTVFGLTYESSGVTQAG